MSVSFAGGSRRRPAATEKPADSAGSDGARKDARSGGRVACVSARLPSSPPHAPVAWPRRPSAIFFAVMDGSCTFSCPGSKSYDCFDTLVPRRKELPPRTRVVPSCLLRIPFPCPFECSAIQRRAASLSRRCRQPAPSSSPRGLIDARDAMPSLSVPSWHPSHAIDRLAVAAGASCTSE